MLSPRCARSVPRARTLRLPRLICGLCGNQINDANVDGATAMAAYNAVLSFVMGTQATLRRPSTVENKRRSRRDMIADVKKEMAVRLLDVHVRGRP